MAGFSQYSQIVKPAEYVEPVSLDILAKGTLYKEQMLEQNLEGINNLISYMDNIPSLQGIDTEKKNEILNNVKQQASQLSYSDLANPAVANQLKGYISSVTKDPDMQGIIERGTLFESEIKKKKDAESKGKNYYSPVIDQAVNYINNGKYLKETRFNGEGFVDPELQKLKADYLKNVPKVKTQKKVGGYWVETESYDQDALNAALSELYSRPDAQKYLNYTFAQKYADVNWDDKGREKVNELLIKAQQTADLAKANLAKTPNDVKALADLAEANNFIENYQSLLNNPSLIGSQLKNAVINQDVQNMINEDIRTSNFMSQLSVNEDQFALKSQELSNSLYMKSVDEQYKIAGELRKLQDESGLDPSLYKNNMNEYRKQAVNIINKKKEEEKGSKNSTSEGPEYFVGSTKYSQKELVDEIEGGNKTLVKQILKNNPSIILSKDKEPDDIVSYDVKTGVYTDKDGNTVVGKWDIFNNYAISENNYNQIKNNFNLDTYLKELGAKLKK